jgi:hypothetical protein
VHVNIVQAQLRLRKRTWYSKCRSYTNVRRIDS